MFAVIAFLGLSSFAQLSGKPLENSIGLGASSANEYVTLTKPEEYDKVLKDLDLFMECSKEFEECKKLPIKNFLGELMGWINMTNRNNEQDKIIQENLNTKIFDAYEIEAEKRVKVIDNLDDLLYHKFLPMMIKFIMGPTFMKEDGKFIQPRNPTDAD